MTAGTRHLQATVALVVLLSSPLLRADADSSDESAASFSSATQSVGVDPFAAAGVQFADVSAALGNVGNQRTWAVAWADYDDDGWVDVFLNNHTSEPVMLRNNGGASFSDVSLATGMNVRRDHHTCHWADYQNDGDQDLYCTTGGKRGTGSVPASFWRNNGDGSFSEIADQLGVVNGRGRGRSVTWLDMELDGDLDLFVGNRQSETTSPPSVLYRNDGGNFAEIGAQAGIALPGRVTYSSAFDYDADGDADLLLAYMAFDVAGSPCASCILVMRNDGAGHFSALTGDETGLDATHWIMAMTIGDYDNDGDNDVFVSGTGPTTKHLYRNGGNGAFSEVSVASTGMSALLAEPVRQASWADFDNDGWLDLFFIIDDQGGSRPNMFFLGNGDGTFRNATEGSGIDGTHAGLGDVAATADFDNDGFLDILVGNGANEATGPYELFRNGGNANHWLRVRLNGSPAATASGSKIAIVSDGHAQFREYADQGDGHAFHEPVAHFGLGASTVVDSLIVTWPDGSVSALQTIAADQLIGVEFSQQPVNEVPLVAISAPVDGAGFMQGDEVGFAATAMDAEDGDLTDALGWVSDRDGSIGSGGGFSTSSLSAGTHLITASVMDSGGLTGSAEMALTIIAPGNAAPVVTIDSPADDTSFNEGETVNFTGSATDDEDGTLTGSLTWSSSLDGPIGSGGSFSSTTLSVGMHDITASVSDSSGAPGTASIHLAIAAVGGGAVVVLMDSGDTYSRQAKEDRNFGSQDFMRVDGPGEGKLGFVKFDVSVLSGMVTEAVLQLRVTDVLDSGVLEAHAVHGSWSESGLTHDNKPPYGAALADVALTSADEGTTVSLDVTSLVQQWAATPAAAFGIALSSDALHAVFDTRETANAPFIEATLNGSANASPAVTIDAPADGASFVQGDSVSFAGSAMDVEEGDLSGSLSWDSSRDGIIGSGSSFSSTTSSVGTHTITASVSDGSGAPGSDSIEVVIVSPGGGSMITLVDSADTFSNKARPGANFGSRKFARAHGPNEKKVGFVQFDVSALSGTVNGAALNLFVRDVLASGVLDVHAVQEDWSELELTHDNRPPYGPPVASLALTPADEDSLVSLDLTGLVQQWAVSPATAFGIALTSQNLHVKFDTREAANAPAIEVQQD